MLNAIQHTSLQRQPSAQAHISSDADLGRTTILIVEDQALLALHAELVLSDAGFLVVGTTADAQSAIRLAENTRPDLVLMDVRLRGDGADGVDTAIEIWERFGIRSFFVTGNADIARSARAAAANAAGVLAKPYEDAPLVRAIRAALG